jgi:hypothetical protein
MLVSVGGGAALAGAPGTVVEAVAVAPSEKVAVTVSVLPDTNSPPR